MLSARGQQETREGYGYTGIVVMGVKSISTHIFHEPQLAAS